jgi:hypothetical protein
MSNDWLEGSGMNQGLKTKREEVLSQRTWTEPSVMLWMMQMMFMRMIIPNIPESLHQYESPFLRGPGTVLTPVVCPALDGPTRVKAAAPLRSLRDASVTA